MNARFRILFFAFLGCISNVYATEHYSAARFTEDSESLQNIIIFPEIEKDGEFRIFCDAHISSSGRFYNTYCFPNRNKIIIRLENAIFRAVERARINAAVVDGINKSVWFQFTVEFVKEGSYKHIDAYPNHGYETKNYGKNYSSAQRIRVKATTSRNLARRFARCSSHTKIWVKSLIQSNGLPTDAEIIGGIGNPACKKDIVTYFLKDEFIPAISDGKPFTSIYKEVFFNHVVAR